jgi:hypothetical protein
VLLSATISRLTRLLTTEDESPRAYASRIDATPHDAARTSRAASELSMSIHYLFPTRFDERHRPSSDQKVYEKSDVTLRLRMTSSSSPDRAVDQ